MNTLLRLYETTVFLSVACIIMMVHDIVNGIDSTTDQILSLRSQKPKTKSSESDFQEILSKIDRGLYQRYITRNNRFLNQSSGSGNLDYTIIPCLLSSEPIAATKFKLDILYFRIDPGENESYKRQPDIIFSNNYSLLDISNASINLNLPTTIITHGFNDGWPGFDNWLQVIKEIHIKRATEKSNLFFFIWKVPDFIQRNNYFIRYGRIVNSLRNLSYYLGEFINHLCNRSSQNCNNLDSVELMGHSLGAHIVGLSARYVDRISNKKIGRLIALDPALPCFSNMKTTIDKDDVKSLKTTHTNAGLEGMASKSSNIDIIVNGGTLQPGCGYDSTCSHGLARLIYNYVDEECQMVAYRCSTYDQFRLGACNSCENSTGNNILVNYPQQTNQEHINDNSTTIEHVSQGGQSYFVDTSPIQLANDSLCLQHYQIRLLLVGNEDDRGIRRCRSLIRQFSRRRLNIYLSGNDSEPAKVVELNSIKSGQLFTGLLTFPGAPKKFSLGLMPDIRQKRIDRDCFIVVEVAFMSNIKSRIRARYSSLLTDKTSYSPYADEEMIIALTEVKSRDLYSATGTNDTCQAIGGLIDPIIQSKANVFNKGTYETSLIARIISFLLFFVPT